MRRYLFIALALFCCSPALAQNTADAVPYKNHNLTLSVGTSLPRYNFEESDFEDEYPAFARGGLLLTGSYRHRFGGHFAAGASVAYRHNRFNLDALLSDEHELLQDKGSTPWKSVFGLADVYYVLPFREAEFYLKGSAGISSNRSASWYFTSEYGDFSMPADQATALALGAGIGFDLLLDKINLTSELSVLYSQPTFDVLDTKGEPLRHRQQLPTINLTVGALIGW